MNVVKAEILWSRTCSLKCSYCAMVDGRKNIVPLEKWKKGIDQLKKLGCSFLAVYGAEPLDDFNKLPEVIEYVEGKGINTTVITNGITKDLYEKLRLLYKHGLRSITTSYDMFSTDASSQLKTNKALEVIDTFRSFGPVRDSAIVVTLTRLNYKQLPFIIKEMTRENIWTFFDLIHSDRGQLGSKVKGLNPDLMFLPEDMETLADVLHEVSFMKRNGFLCHSSDSFLKRIMNSKANNLYKWNCATENSFPAFITVDCDGIVMPCDDYFNSSMKQIPIWEIADKWDEFCSIWKTNVLLGCPGCCWNTHLGAYEIKDGKLSITEYIHGLEE